MNLSLPRRFRAAALATAVAGAGLLAVPSPADAAVLGMTAVQTRVEFDDNPDVGVTCATTGPGDVTNGPAVLAANGVPVSLTSSSNAVITDNANASDKTTMSGSVTHTITATQANGQLSKVHMATTATTSVTTQIANTKCHASVQAGGISQFQFDLVAPTLVTVTAEAHRMIGIVQVGNITGPTESDIQAVALYALGNHGTSTGTVLLPAGPGMIGVHQASKEADAPSTATTVSASGDLTVDITFDVPGSATGAQVGSGKKYVGLDEGRGCAAGTLSMTWTKKAGKGDHRAIKKAIVRVDGAKVATIKKPKKGQVSTITGLNAEKTADVEVVLKVRGKGKSTVERSYRRCV